PTGFQRDFEHKPVQHRDLDAAEVEVGGHGFVTSGGERRYRSPGAADNGIYTNDGIFCGEVLIRHLHGSVTVEHGLKPVHGLYPCEVLDVAVGLSQLPGDDRAIGKFFDVVRPRHSRLEEDTDCRGVVDQPAASFRQRLETSDADTAAAAVF